MSARCAEPGTWGDCELPDYDDRGYDVYVPTRAASEPVPLMVALHGAGGRSGAAISTSCAGGDRSDESCLHTIAEDEGVAVVYPNGSGLLRFGRLRAWNAGGGGDWDCTSGRACENDVDDVAYITALLDDVEGWLDVDPGRVTIAPCEPEVPVAIMQVHGTEDTCWSYETSDRSCADLPFGGHTWPGGDAPLPEPLIGRVTQDWDSSVIWEFLARFER